MSEFARNMFARELAKLLVSPLDVSGRKERRRALVKAFLAFGSETEDNVSCVKHLDYGVLPISYKRGRELTLKIKGKPIPLGRLAWSAAATDRIPARVRRDYPDLTLEEWHAFQRFMTMVFIAFERELPRRTKKRKP
jgi:hypothetical protein